VGQPFFKILEADLGVYAVYKHADLDVSHEQVGQVVQACIACRIPDAKLDLVPLASLSYLNDFAGVCDYLRRSSTHRRLSLHKCLDDARFAHVWVSHKYDFGALNLF